MSVNVGAHVHMHIDVCVSVCVRRTSVSLWRLRRYYMPSWRNAKRRSVEVSEQVYFWPRLFLFWDSWCCCLVCVLEVVFSGCCVLADASPFWRCCIPHSFVSYVSRFVPDMTATMPCIHTRTHARMWACPHTCGHVHSQRMHVHTLMHTCMCTRMHTYARTCMHTHVPMRTHRRRRRDRDARGAAE